MERAALMGMETGLTRTMGILALTCFLIVGAAAASVLGRDSVPAPSPSIGQLSLKSSSAPVQGPSSNREGKKDRLPVMITAAVEPGPNLQGLPENLRQAFASESPVNARTPAASGMVAIPQQAAPKPKVALKPPVQKSYALLSDIQIAGIKERLKFTPDQESYWPAVEGALKGIARRLHATRPGGNGTPQIDTEWAEVQQLKSAAMPLLWTLRDDQKREVRSLANLIGLTAVASMI